MNSNSETIPATPQTGMIDCPSCEKPNGLTRRFCGECGESLRFACPNCETENSFADRFCGDCGTDLQDRREKDWGAFSETLQNALRHAASKEFGLAIRLLEKQLKSPEQIPPGKQKELESQLTDYRQQRQQDKTAAAEELAAAKQLLEENLYSQALERLSNITGEFMTDEVQGLQKETQQKLAKGQRLKNELKSLLAEKNYVQVLPVIQSLIGLYPRDEQLGKLATTVTAKVLARAEKLRSIGRYRSALAEMASLNSEDVEGSDGAAALREELVDILCMTEYVKRSLICDPHLLAMLEFLKDQPGNEKIKPYWQRAEKLLKSAPQSNQTNSTEFPVWTKPPEKPNIGMSTSYQPPLCSISGTEKLPVGGEEPTAFWGAIGLALSKLVPTHADISLWKPKKSLLNGLFKAKKPEAMWGIDVGETSLKAVKLSLAEGMITIEHCKRIRFGGDGISRTDLDTRECQLSALKELKSEFGISDDETVCVNLNSQRILARFLELPKVDGKKLTAILEHELNRQLPFELEDLQWDVHLQTLDNENQQIATVLAAKKTDVNRQVELLETAKLKVAAVVPPSIALINLVIREMEAGNRFGAPQEAGNKNGHLLLTSWGAQDSLVCRIDSNRFWFRNIPHGGHEITRSISRKLLLTFEDAEKIKMDLRLAGDDIPKALRAAMTPLASWEQEVTRSIQAIGREMKMESPEHMVVVGGASRTVGLRIILEHGPAALDKPVS